jgi:hypothetical protein
MTVPINQLPHRTPVQLLAIARQGLDEAERCNSVGNRYAGAHLAALRAAAALLSLRAVPGPKQARVRPVWALLGEVAPEFAEWTAFFGDRAQKRAAAEAGIPRVVTEAEASAMVSAAGQFIALIAAEVESTR